jgi:hypothetical protein
VIIFSYFDIRKLVGGGEVVVFALKLYTKLDMFCVGIFLTN